ncbi:MAG: hypothetical protein KIT84_23275 [Labilithrix sp.]|nr:hypothetical protein [Labilithrix sp.]MCW5813969.1 hypothetical protein [Labilithrix sp.]
MIAPLRAALVAVALACGGLGCADDTIADLPSPPEPEPVPVGPPSAPAAEEPAGESIVARSPFVGPRPAATHLERVTTLAALASKPSVLNAHRRAHHHRR